jgi:hypothetical protein
MLQTLSHRDSAGVLANQAGSPQQKHDHTRVLDATFTCRYNRNPWSPGQLHGFQTHRDHDRKCLDHVLTRTTRGGLAVSSTDQWYFIACASAQPVRPATRADRNNTLHSKSTQLSAVINVTFIYVVHIVTWHVGPGTRLRVSRWMATWQVQASIRRRTQTGPSARQTTTLVL